MRSRCSPTSCAPTTPTSRSVTPTSRCSSARCRARPGMERTDLLTANGGIFKPQGEALVAQRQAGRQDPRGRQPGQHQRADREEQRDRTSTRGRFTAMTRLDHNRAVQPARAEARRRRHRRQQHDDLGQPLDDAVPRPVPLRGRRTQRLRGRRRSRLGRRHVHPHRRQARRGDHRGPRRVVGGVGGQRRGRSHPLVVAGHAPKATGCRWRSRRDGSYGVPEGLISSFPCTCRDGEYSIVQGLDIDEYSRGKIDASAAELVDERDAVQELGLI